MINYRTGLIQLGYEDGKDFKFKNRQYDSFEDIEFLPEDVSKTDIVLAFKDYVIANNEIENNAEMFSRYSKFDTGKGKSGVGNQFDAIYKGFCQLEDAGIFEFTGYTKEWMEHIKNIKDNKTK